MTANKIALPEHWEDWVNLALGVWLCASPWALQTADDLTVAQNAFIVGFLLIVVEVVTLSAFYLWEEWVSAALGAWLVISPWVLGLTAIVPVANFVIVGLLVLGLALYEIWEVRRQTAHPA